MLFLVSTEVVIWFLILISLCNKLQWTVFKVLNVFAFLESAPLDHNVSILSFLCISDIQLTKSVFIFMRDIGL